MLSAVFLGGSFMLLLDMVSVQSWSIILIAVSFTWFHIALALRMCFFPLEFRGLSLAGIRLGWQGIVPSKAMRMARKACDLIIDRLIFVDPVVDQISGDKLFAHFVSLGVAEEIEVGVHERLRRRLLSRAPTKIATYMLSQSRGIDRAVCVRFVSELKTKLKDRAFFDVRDLIIHEFTSNKQLLVHLFTQVGSRELEFIEMSGCLMGLLCGLGQLMMYSLFPTTSAPFFLFAITGLIIGYFTNWLALFVIFHPVDPVRIAGITVQGLFLRRQREVASLYAKIVTETVLNVEKVIQRLKATNRWNIVLELFDNVLRDELDQSIKLPFLTVKQEAALVDAIAGETKAELAMHTHIIAREVPEFIETTIQLEQLLESKLSDLPSLEFDGILHPVFQEDEFTLIVLGGVLGALVGLLQVYLFNL